MEEEEEVDRELQAALESSPSLDRPFEQLSEQLLRRGEQVLTEAQQAGTGNNSPGLI